MTSDLQNLISAECNNGTPNKGQQAFLEFMGDAIYVSYPFRGPAVLAVSAEDAERARQWLLEHNAPATVRRAKHVSTFLGFAQGIR